MPAEKEKPAGPAAGGSREREQPSTGRSLAPADKRRCVEIALREFPNLSSRAVALKTWPEKSAAIIADQVGCTHAFVSRIRAEVCTSTDLPSRVTGKDGKSYPARREPKGTEMPRGLVHISAIADDPFLMELKLRMIGRAA